MTKRGRVDVDGLVHVLWPLLEPIDSVILRPLSLQYCLYSLLM